MFKLLQMFIKVLLGMKMMTEIIHGNSWRQLSYC